MDRLIPANRSLIVAADVRPCRCAGLMRSLISAATHIGAVKLGFSGAYNGLADGVDRTRFGLEDWHDGQKVPIIFDPQKGATDIPDMGQRFAAEVKRARCDAVILFPFAGPATQSAWTKYCQDAGLRVIIGAVMTHPQFLVSEGGYIADDAPLRIFAQACKDGVTDFVVPGSKIAWVTTLRQQLVGELGPDSFDLYAPGLGKVPGDIRTCAAAAGLRFHAIVGGPIYDAAQSDRVSVAHTLTEQLE